MFLNYFKNDRLTTPINIATARLILSFYLCWKLLSYDFNTTLTTFPPLSDRYGFARHPVLLEFIEIEVAVTIAVLLLFAIGYREGATGFLSCLLISHLAMMRFGWNWSGGTTADFIAVYFIAFFALYREYDILSVDNLYRSGYTLSDYNEILQRDDSGETKAPMLKCSLIVLALIYFGSAFGKVTKGPVWEWVKPSNLMMHTHRMRGVLRPELPLSEFLATTPVVAGLASIGTILLEGGFLIAVLAGLSVIPFAIGLMGMVVIVGISMGPFFFDVYLFLAALANWELLFRNPNDEITLVYDEYCLFCAQSLLPFKLADVSKTINFHTQSSVPDTYDSPKYEFESAMYVFADGEAYRGYHAFKRLMFHYPALKPLGWAMAFPPVTVVGGRVYEYIAKNRNRYFTCSVEKEV